MKKKVLINIFILLILITDISSAEKFFTDKKDLNNYYLSLNLGLQMSGIKDEDFISSNYTPLFNITAGKWLTPYLALQIGYKGFYFNTIADDIKHHYNYYYGEVVINFNNFVDPNRVNKNWNIHLHGGPGYFYNHVYERASIHLNMGIQNNFQIANNIYTHLDISSIVGWDIYQGDEDILPGITLGITFFLK